MVEKKVKILKRITLTEYSDGKFGASFEGIRRRAEVLPLLKKCDRVVLTRLNQGASLGEEDSKIEILSP